MLTRGQKFRIVILVLILVAAIIGGVFYFSGLKGGVTYPWQVAMGQSDAEEVAAKPEPAQEQTVETDTKESDKEEAVKDTAIAETPEIDEAAQEPEIVEEAQETEEETVAQAEALPYYGALSVNDQGQLVDESGKTAQLTGVSSHGLSWYGDYITKDSVTYLRDNWGINCLRLAMYTSDYNGYCVAGEDNQQALKDRIKEAVEAATENDMYVIIDWHILNDSDPNEYKAQAIQFFGEMVRLYKGNEHVIYEICNEPNRDTSWEDICDYANEVIPVIRNVDKKALILVGTPSWCQDLTEVMESPLDYSNIMYTYHFYAGSHGTKARNQLMEALEAGLPVFISEYGYTNADGDGDINEKEADSWKEVIDEYGLSTCIWNLSNKEEASSLIKADCDKTCDWTEDDLTAQGQYFLNTLSTKEKTENDN